MCASIRTPRMTIARYKHYHRGLESGPAIVMEVKRGRSEKDPRLEAAEDPVLRKRQGKACSLCALRTADQLQGPAVFY